MHTPYAYAIDSTIDTSPLLGHDVRGDDTTHDDEIDTHDEIHHSTNSAATTSHSDSEAEHDTSIQKPTLCHVLTSTGTFFTELAGVFSWRFLSWLAIDQCCVTGGAYSLVQATALPLMKSLGIGASRQQMYTSVIMSPWAMKPFIGVASDLFTIQGYNKRYFALYSILVGLVGSIMLLWLYHSGFADNAIQQGADAVEYLADMIILCFTALSYEAATLDILGEGKYAEMMNLHPESGSSIICFKFGWSLLGGIVTQSYVGPLSDAGYFHVLIFTAFVLSLTPFYPTLVGWIPEKKRTVNEPGMVKLCSGCLFDRGSFEERKTPFIIITLCGLSAPLLAAVTTYTDLEVGLAFAGVLILAFVVITYSIFPRTFFWVFLSVIISTVCTISISSALGYYYTASKECVPDGPNFDYTYYITVTGVGGCIVNFLAVIVYQKFLRGWRYWPVLISIKLICAFSSIIDLIIVMRWNIAIGIPDEVMFLLTNLRKLNKGLLAIPMSSIYAKIAPPGMESAVVAYTVGIVNFSDMVATLLGSGVIHWSGMKTVGVNCDFGALPYLIVISQILVPVAVSIPITFMIPNVLQTEQMIDWEKESWGSESDVNTGKPGRGKNEDVVDESTEDPFCATSYCCDITNKIT